jgi:hypothetical protein
MPADNQEALRNASGVQNRIGSSNTGRTRYAAFDTTHWSMV